MVEMAVDKAEGRVWEALTIVLGIGLREPLHRMVSAATPGLGSSQEGSQLKNPAYTS